MLKAVFIKTYDGKTEAAGSIASVDGKLVVEGLSDNMRQSIWEWGIVAATANGPKYLHPDETPAEEFVRALPDAFNGSAVRVKLESE